MARQPPSRRRRSPDDTVERPTKGPSDLVPAPPEVQLPADWTARSAAYLAARRPTFSMGWPPIGHVTIDVEALKAEIGAAGVPADRVEVRVAGLLHELEEASVGFLQIDKDTNDKRRSKRQRAAYRRFVAALADLCAAGLNLTNVGRPAQTDWARLFEVDWPFVEQAATAFYGFRTARRSPIAAWPDFESAYPDLGQFVIRIGARDAWCDQPWPRGGVRMLTATACAKLHETKLSTVIRRLKGRGQLNRAKRLRFAR